MQAQKPVIAVVMALGVLALAGGPGPLPGQFDGVHQISVDQERNLYVTEVWNGRTQKFRPKANADPGKIVGPPVGGWPPR